MLVLSLMLMLMLMLVLFCCSGLAGQDDRVAPSAHILLYMQPSMPQQTTSLKGSAARPGLSRPRVQMLPRHWDLCGTNRRT